MRLPERPVEPALHAGLVRGRGLVVGDEHLVAAGEQHGDRDHRVNAIQLCHTAKQTRGGALRSRRRDRFAISASISARVASPRTSTAPEAGTGAEFERQVGTMALSQLEGTGALALMRAVAWHNSLARLGLSVP